LKEFSSQDPEEFTERTFLDVMKTSLAFLYKKHKRYINIDEYAEILGRMKNVNLMSLYDCCREKPATKSSINAIVDESET
jgi:hypothetical protein